MKIAALRPPGASVYYQHFIGSPSQEPSLVPSKSVIHLNMSQVAHKVDRRLEKSQTLGRLFLQLPLYFLTGIVTTRIHLINLKAEQIFSHL